MKRSWCMLLCLCVTGCEIVGRMEVRSDFRHPEEVHGTTTAVVAVEWKKVLGKEARHAGINQTARQ
jgi:hypothetical protein